MKFRSAFIIFFLVGIVLYRNTAGAGFVTDEIGWLQSYKTIGWKGLLCAFGDKSPHYIYHVFGFALWKVFGLHGKGWMLFFVSVHALVAALSSHIFGKLFSNTEIAKPKLVAFAGGLIFLISPYHTEPLVWYACVHYLVCTALVLLCIACWLRYRETARQKFVLLFYLFVFLAAFTLELSFSLPFITATLILFFPWNAPHQKQKELLLFVIPSLIAAAFYFAVTKFTRGNFTGHYGAATHFNMDITLLMGNLAKYTAKVFLFTQFLEYDKRNSLYLFFERPTFGSSLFFILVVIAIAFIVYHKKLPRKLVTTLILFALFAFALLPVLTLFFSYIVNIEGDRFTYLAIVFSSQFVAFSMVAFLSYAGWLTAIVFVFYSVHFLRINTNSWKHNRNINFALCEKFKWYNATEIYLLNMPDNFGGSYMFRSFPPDNSFAETLALRYGKDIESKVTQVLEYNMNQPTDGTTVDKLNDSTLKVRFTNYGSWWWQKGIGGSSYSTDDYAVKIDEWGTGYTIIFKNKKPGSVYLYQTGDELKEVTDF